MTIETAPKVLRDEAPPLLPAALIENDAQALRAAHQVAKQAREGAAQRDREPDGPTGAHVATRVAGRRTPVARPAVRSGGGSASVSAPTMRRNTTTPASGR